MLANKYFKITIKVMIIIFLLLTYYGCLMKSLDTDMYFLVASGRDILDGNFYTNSYTGLSVVIQQWLYDVILAKFVGNNTIFQLFFVFLQNLLLLSVSSIFMYKKTHKLYNSIVLPLFCLITTSHYLINIRPECITITLLVLQIIVLEKYKESGNKFKYLLWLIPICLLEANLHNALFLYHILFLLPYIDKKVTLMSIPMLGCSLCTPYGLDGFLYVFNSYRYKTFDYVYIEEVSRLFSISSKTINYVYISIILIMIFSLVILLNIKKKSTNQINIYSILVILLSLISYRHNMLIYIPLLLISIVINFDYIILVCSIALLLYNGIYLTPQYPLSFEIPSYIQKEDTTFASFVVGNYLEYNGYKTYIDARPELYMPYMCGENRLYEYRLLMYGLDLNENKVDDEEILKILDKFKYSILRDDSYAATLIRDKYIDRYTELEIVDEKYIIFKKEEFRK